MHERMIEGLGYETDPGDAEAPAFAQAFAQGTVKPLLPREFRLFRALVYREAGIHLSDAKQALLAGRLARRVRELGLPSYGDYYRRVEADAAERRRMLEAVCTHETHFFREPRHWELLARAVLPRWREEADAGLRPRRARAWSAGCSSGEEPYTLAMVLLEHLPAAEGWSVEVTATDFSRGVLERARTALWPLAKADAVPAAYRRRWMLKGTRSQEGRVTVAPEVRGVVRFLPLNLHDERWPVEGAFDLVLCRNVLIYFDAASRARAVGRLLDRVAPGGLFFLGHAESLTGLPGLAERVRSVIPTVYTPREGAA